MNAEAACAVTVMIPVYNGSKHLRETISSLQKQSFTHFRVVFADDGSLDDSASIIREYASDARICLISMDRNLGYASRVVSKILSEADSEFVVYSSQDDLYSVDWLQKMVCRAGETGADAVVPDLVFLNDPHEHPPLVGVRGDRSAVIGGRDALDLSLDWTIPGNCLWRTSVVKPIGFPDVGAWSDELAVRQFFLACNKVAFCDAVFFYRQDNPDAITKKLTPRTFDSLLVNVIEIPNLLRDANFPIERQAFALMSGLNQLCKLARRIDEIPAAERSAIRQIIYRCVSYISRPEVRTILRQLNNITMKDYIRIYLCTNGVKLFLTAIKASRLREKIKSIR